MFGIDGPSFDSIQHSADGAYIAGYPNLDWWDNGPINRVRTYSYSDEVMKKFNMAFFGATNSVTLFVPYRGDYEIIAIDQYGNIIGKRTIYSENYRGGVSTQKYQKVSFAVDKHFDLAEGIEDGNKKHACRYSSVVEWGGGVSGAYYTYGAGSGIKDCDKSNDAYVKEHSAQYLAIRPLGTNRVSVLKFNHPLPYANIVFVVTVNKTEKREYSCYQDASCEIKQ